MVRREQTVWEGCETFRRWSRTGGSSHWGWAWGLCSPTPCYFIFCSLSLDAVRPPTSPCCSPASLPHCEPRCSFLKWLLLSVVSRQRHTSKTTAGHWASAWSGGSPKTRGAVAARRGFPRGERWSGRRECPRLFVIPFRFISRFATVSDRGYPRPTSKGRPLFLSMQ